MRVCVCVLGEGSCRCRKDTPTNQRLHLSSGLSHRDLEFPQVAVLSQQSFSLKPKQRLAEEGEDVCRANTSPVKVLVLKRPEKKVHKKVRTSLMMLNGRDVKLKK